MVLTALAVTQSCVKPFIIRTGCLFAANCVTAIPLSLSTRNPWCQQVSSELGILRGLFSYKDSAPNGAEEEQQREDNSKAPPKTGFLEIFLCQFMSFRSFDNHQYRYLWQITENTAPAKFSSRFVWFCWNINAP